MTATPRERAEARIGPLVPEGWRLADPERFSGGWRLHVDNVADPLVSTGVWNEDLETAIGMLVEELEKRFRPKH